MQTSAAIPFDSSVPGREMLDQRFSRVAVRLLTEIRRRHVRAADGRPVWRVPRAGQQNDPVPVDAHLYGGTAGIALALTAGGKTLGRPDQIELGLETITPLARLLREIVADPGRSARLRMAIGGFAGIGSLIYCCAQIGRLTGSEELAETAFAITRLLSRERIAGDRILDVMSGAAGTVLALAALDELYPGRGRPLDLARVCARHLARHRVEEGGRFRGWATPSRRPLTGFTHGAAGISYALVRLYRRTGDPELLRAAAEGYRFEREHFSPAAGNWRDLRQEPPGLTTSWCYGAPGIVLARLDAIGTLEDEPTRREIRVGLDTTLGHPMTVLDHLCCGNAGRAAVLYAAARRLDDSDLARAARSLAGRTLERAATRGGLVFRLEPAHSFFDPSFFTGAAGVAFTLLQLGGHDSLPEPMILG